MITALIVSGCFAGLFLTLVGISCCMVAGRVDDLSSSEKEFYNSFEK